MEKDYLLEVRVKNNILAKLIKAQGFASVAEFCREYGLLEVEVGLALNLKTPLYTKKGGIRAIWLRLSDVFKILPEDLCPKNNHYDAVKTNKVERELTCDEVQSYLAAPETEPENLLIQHDGIDRLYAHMKSKLSNREYDIYCMYNGLDGCDPHTLKEVGEKYGVSADRVRQICAKSERKLKYKECYTHTLRDIADDIYGTR